MSRRPSAVAHEPQEQDEPRLSQDYTKLARILAWKMARLPADREDLQQEALLALHRAFRETRERGFPMAYTVMQRAMMKYNRRPEIRDRKQHVDLLESPQELSDIADIYLENIRYCIDPETQLHNDFWEDEYFVALEHAHGPMARRVAENLISPKDPEVCRRILNIVKKKLARTPRAMCRSELSRKAMGGKRVIHISRKQVQLGLGIPQYKWLALIDEIKGFTRTWLATHADSVTRLPGTM